MKKFGGKKIHWEITEIKFIIDLNPDGMSEINIEGCYLDEIIEEEIQKVLCDGVNYKITKIEDY